MRRRGESRGASVFGVVRAEFWLAMDNENRELFENAHNWRRFHVFCPIRGACCQAQWKWQRDANLKGNSLTKKGKVDYSVPLTHHDPKDLGLTCLVNKRKICFRILSDLRIQSWIFVKKPTLKSSDQYNYIIKHKNDEKCHSSNSRTKLTVHYWKKIVCNPNLATVIVWFTFWILQCYFTGDE